jgi:hypothetical protein
MKPEVKQQLLKAMRSGEYTLIQGQLRQEGNNGRCIGGLLCDLYSQDQKVSYWKWDDKEGWSFLGNTFDIPTAVQYWAGLSFEETRNLTRTNDDWNGTFAELAEVIEL